jgi:hypothetical protein
MLNLGENSSEKLFFAAKFYKTRGWSVIPLIGGMNLHDLKRPAIKWGRYQHTLPEIADLENWFLKLGFGGLGVVCGRVSKLAVLDFDDSQKASEFLRLHPHLTQTRVVESGTRHLPHYYYHIPDELSVHSRSVLGADFRADGAYVVAPPTGQGEIRWRVLHDEPLYTLSAGDLKAIWRFLASPIPPPSPNRFEAPSQSNSSQFTHLTAVSVTELGVESKRRRNSYASINDLLVLYRGRLDQGRNNALFQVACIARDRGVGQEVVIEKLATIHASQPASDGLSESFQVRHAEALRTIESVYSRPARPPMEAAISNEQHEAVGIPTPSETNVVSGLLNSIREWLLGHAFAAAARVLDGLILAGLKIHSTFTERQACDLLQQYRVGRRSVMAALKTVLPDGKPLFEKITEPLHASPIHADAVTHSKTGLKKCVLVKGANRVKTSGRPSAHYHLPDNETLTQRIGLASSPVDLIDADDLASPQQYRRALHRELVKRRPGSYSRGWLSDRLGISKWTSRRYEATLNIVVQPMYIEQSVRWINVEALVPRTIEDTSPGTFLETEDGKRYPPLRSIAMHLLDAGRRIVHKTRIANHYALLNSEGIGIPTASVPIRASISLMPVSRVNDSYSHPEALSCNPAEKTDTNNGENISLPQKAVGIPTPSLSDTQHLTLSTQHQFWLCPSCLKTHIAADPPETCVRCGATNWERIPDAIWRDQERLKIYWQIRWREKHPSSPRSVTPLVDSRSRRNSDAFQNAGPSDSHITRVEDECAAQQVHERIPDLSRINALRLVSRYGISKVEDAINRLAHRSGIRNPAGFLVSLLKLEYLFYSRKVLKSRQRSAEDAATWVRQMTESDYLDFLANADEFIACDKSK